MKRRLILASGSKQRRALVEALGLEFEVIASNIDEKQITATTDRERARLIAVAKAKAVSSSHPEAVVIAGDTFTYVNGRAYEKPIDLEQAAQFLKEQSGQKGVCYSGCAYLDPKNKIEFSTTVETSFIFRDLSEREISGYVANNPVLTWSAGFCPAYPEGINLIRAVAGSLSNFSHGLPMEVIIPLLEQSGVFNEED